MNVDIWLLFVFSVLYLGLLFLIASAAENKWIPSSLVNHPIVYTLSIGVYATSWSYYGSVGLAEREGFTFLAVYLGVTIAFLASPILLRPIMLLVKEYQLSSLADMLAFRYHSPLAGILVTVFMLTGALPYMALQIQAVTDSIKILTSETDSGLLAFGFCLTISLFAILFGARHVTPREKHEGLVVAIAFESLIKLIALLLVGAYAVFGIFDGFHSFDLWIEQNPHVIEEMMAPVQDGPWGMMLLLSFAAAFLLPRQFHMIFVENDRSDNLNFASWAFPLFLLLLNLSIPPILWAGQLMDLSYGPDMYVLAVSMQSQNTMLPIFIFVGGISAASAMIIVASIALASMCLNHLVLPMRISMQKSAHFDLYRMLLWSKRVLILLIILAGYAFYLLLKLHQELTDLGLIAFVAVAQFLPGIVGLLYWRRASRTGFISGLIGGSVVWSITLILPLLAKAGWLDDSILLNLMIPMTSTDSAFWSLALNSSLFVLASLLWPQSEQEQKAANACCNNRFYTSPAIPFASSIEQFETGLAEILGDDMAHKEIQLAMSDLSLNQAQNHNDLDRNDFAQLRQQIRHNLTGLMGPVLADMVVDEQFAIDTSARVAIADTLHFVEKSLQGSRLELKEMASELDSLRRFHRQVLHDLPLAVVTVSAEQQVLSWNRAMEELTSIDEDFIIGQHLSRLEPPWSELLQSFVRSPDNLLRSVKLRKAHQLSILNLFKSEVSPQSSSEQAQVEDRIGHNGFVVVIEDHSELHKLESELEHSERLASIGRLATGVAHEIGNPVTGIACLAQDIQATPEDRELHQQGLDDILQLTERITSIVHSLVSYSHVGAEPDQTPERITVKTMADEAIRLVSLSHKGKRITFDNQCNKKFLIQGNHQKLLQVLVILLSNASDAVEENGLISIGCLVNEDQTVITVEDNGTGIEESILSKVFDPFFTTKSVGEGTGLGLSLAYNIIKEHGGSIEVQSEPGDYTRFEIFLPLYETTQ